MGLLLDTNLGTGHIASLQGKLASLLCRFGDPSAAITRDEMQDMRTAFVDACVLTENTFITRETAHSQHCPADALCALHALLANNATLFRIGGWLHRTTGVSETPPVEAWSLELSVVGNAPLKDLVHQHFNDTVDDTETESKTPHK